MVEQATVLVVDDEIGPRESLRAILKPDYQVLMAMEGEQALRVVEQEPVDIVLLDLRMPGLSGVRVLENIKAIDPDIEVILVTGYASYDTVLEALRQHAFDYVAKPFSVPHVREIVKRATVHRHSQKKLKQVAAEVEQQSREFERTSFITDTEFAASYASLFRDLHTSLQTIVDCNHMLQKHAGDQLDASGKDALQRTCVASQRMVQLINTLSSRLRGEPDSV